MLAVRVAFALWAVSKTIATDPTTCPEGVAETEEAALLQSAWRVRPCSKRRWRRCCGDGRCDGPETESTCPNDCADPAPKPCSKWRRRRCCGDGKCDGPETESTCPDDCAAPTNAPTTRAPTTRAPTTRAPTTGAPGPAPQEPPRCSENRTERCCGDGFCDGPETVSNCYEDCTEPPPGPGPAPGPSPPAGGCSEDPPEKPSEPTLCTMDNKGCCDCGQTEIQTFVFWVNGTQRCLHTYNLPEETPTHPLPVVLHMSGYSGGRRGSEGGGKMGAAAKYYGFVVFTIGNNLKDGAGGFGLEFGNNGIANDANPTPCSHEDSREIAYLDKVFALIDQNEKLDATRVFTEGFSQNSMFAVYTAVCFAGRVAGTWQGGSGQARTGSTPVLPGFQGQCSFDSHEAHGRDCCEEEFCTECQYWPLWPKTCGRTLVDCIAAYTDDSIACGSDWYMYEAMAGEGNDARLLSFPAPGGHRDPHNKWAWFAGCLGIAPSCSSGCSTSFQTCMDQATTAEKAHARFASCEAKLKLGHLTDCTAGCAPTLAMLLRSENATVTLSQGKFGTETALPNASSAPRPKCKKDFGEIGSMPGPRPKCSPPTGYTPQPINPPNCTPQSLTARA